ncbi:DUF2695 domain-containing protein [Nocardioides sp.]|uniref:DUF2695 domain-containing protein n=1 Tax=Nocardioides sp. TaxID=35761 RepID=UPI00378452E9
MADMSVTDEAAQYLEMLADPDSEPGLYECIACFALRRVEAVGCDRTLRWAQWFRDVKSPTATALEARLQRIGVYCDCDLAENGYRMNRMLLVRDLRTDELHAPDELPDCAGVRRTSTRPCANWERRPLREWHPHDHR